MLYAKAVPKNQSPKSKVNLPAKKPHKQEVHQNSCSLKCRPQKKPSKVAQEQNLTKNALERSPKCWRQKCKVAQMPKTLKLPHLLFLSLLCDVCIWF